ncbi:MAG: winged helix-turn-helix domain-containing protein [Candidatus Riflebacteria bacterium]|nr:winged helix-turn-helix domain-containing protein [Candidatus Riflebacteria bacterium]
MFTAGDAFPGQEFTAVLHALEVVVGALGRESEARRWAAQRQARGHDSAGWMEALGFTGPDLDTKYLVVADRSAAVATVPSDGPGGLEALELGVDLEGRRLHVAGRGWRSLAGRARPLELLAVFVREPGRCWTKQAIFEEVWGGRFNPESHTANVHGLVRRLRKELTAAGGNPEWVRTDLANGTYGLAANVKCGLWRGACPTGRGSR